MSLKSAQRRYDNELPPEEPPTPEDKGAVPCVCRPAIDALRFATDHRLRFFVICDQCRRSGPARAGLSESVEGWNVKMEKLRREE